MADADVFREFIREQAKALRSNDAAPPSREAWLRRREELRQKMFTAMGPFLEKPCLLEPRVIGTLERDGYRIEKIIFQSRPNIWVTASAYVPNLKAEEKVPAVLAVHGHWPGARRDPVVQARCLGLVKLGFVVLAVDAFGAGERFTVPARGTYHGALYGATLWPAGQTLLGMQVYDNRRAVDYLLSRPEVNGKLGITGASGGGNQTMYAGALDDRFAAVVPVCSVGNYQAYLRSACCVCEVLPGALRFTEEGDVLGLVAPRALLVINATRDGIQFSVPEAEKSVARARDVFKLFDAETKLRHQPFESAHDYNKAMRELMYGWMTLHLKGQGKGEPIPEPEHQVETAEDLACFPDPKNRPEGFLLLPAFAAATGRKLVNEVERLVPDHKEMWESDAANMRLALRRVLGEIPAVEKPSATRGEGATSDGILRTPYQLAGEGKLPIAATICTFEKKPSERPNRMLCIALHPEGQAGFRAGLPALKGYDLVLADLRDMGATKPKNDGIAAAPDHNSAEHSLWIGRPLLGQWVTDVLTLMDWLAAEKHETQVGIIGFGSAGLIALAAGALFPKRISAVATSGTMGSYICETPYAAGTSMGVLVPGILGVGDIPHLAAMIAPRRLVIADPVSPTGKKLTAQEVLAAFAFTQKVYAGTKSPDNLTLMIEPNWAEVSF
jgi:dienelactone hydrolase